MSQILIVEDNPDISELLSILLSSAGYDVLTALHGVEALVLLEKYTPALVTLDLCMPQMDGWALLAAMRADARLSKIPTLVITSVPGDAPLGVPVLAKMPEEATLLEKVRSLLAQ